MLEVKLLGQFEVLRDGRRLILPTHNAQSLGDLSKAVATYERITQGLQNDLGIKPSEQTRALYKRLKSGWGMDTQEEVPTPETMSTQPQQEIASQVFGYARIG